jgi:hypothetical protein
MYWEIGRYINSVVLGGERAEYGKRIFSSLTRKLVERYGNSFTERNLYRMTLFAERFSDGEILPPAAAKLSWSHIIELLPLETDEARMYYVNEVATRRYSAKELRRQISRKAFERQEIANANLTTESLIPFNLFKDPYILDTLGLKENFLEANLEKAMLTGTMLMFSQTTHSIAVHKRQMAN